MDYDLVLPFDRDTKDFARGVEVGMLHQRLSVESLPVEAVIHVDNVEMALRLAESHEVAVRADDSDGDWLSVTFS